jgi:hypothetical protein
MRRKRYSVSLERSLARARPEASFLCNVRTPNALGISLKQSKPVKLLSFRTRITEEHQVRVTSPSADSGSSRPAAAITSQADRSVTDP